jgi:hypothetical protein
MVPGLYLESKFTVVRGIGLAPPLNWGPKPMISRVSTNWAWAWLAASRVTAANREANARVIILPREKSGSEARQATIAAISQAKCLPEDTAGPGFPDTALKKHLRRHPAMAAMCGGPFDETHQE